MAVTVQQQLSTVIETIDDTLQKFDADELVDACKPLESLQQQIQDLITDNLRKPVSQLLEKLEADEPINEQEMKIIERWLVGDADFYVRMENNLIDWVGECKRLFSLISQYGKEDIEDDDTKLLAVGALLTDLQFTLQDITRYVTAMNEVDHFRSLLEGVSLNADAKQNIACQIEKKLTRNPNVNGH